MKLDFKSDKEFRCLLTALLNDLVDAGFHFSLHQNLANAIGKYGKELAQSPTFWGLTLSAHMDAVLLRLCRAYDTYQQPALNLRNLLDTIQAHLTIFDEPNFRQRLKGNPLVDSLAADLKPLNKAQLQKDIEAVSYSDPLVKKLVMWRNNYIAHRNSHFALNPNKLAAQYPLTFNEMEDLITRALQIGNRYSHIFDVTVSSTFMIGEGDYLNILKAVREHLEANEHRLKKELERLGIDSPKSLPEGTSRD